MIGTRFTYLAPEGADAVVAALQEDPAGTRILGGGTWVVPELSGGTAEPRVVVDLRKAGLDGVVVGDDHVTVGATCTYAALLDTPELDDAAPLLRLMAAGVTGGRQLRNQGTVGGSLCAGRPNSEAPAVLSALRAVAVVAGPEGTRRVAAADVVTGAMRTGLADDEVLLRLELPRRRAGERHGYRKLKRGASSWPIATAAAVLTAGSTRDRLSGRLVLGAVADRPVVADLHDAGADEAVAALVDGVERWWADALAPARYRAAVAAPVAHRALAAALGA